MPIHIINMWMGIFIYRRAYLCQFPAGGFFAGVEETCI